MKIKFVDLSVKEEEFNEHYLPVIRDVFSKGMFVGGEEVELFESEFAALCGVDFAVAVNSGTDALFLALKALGIKEGDEVVTVSNSFIATANAIKWAGADVVFADIGDDLLMNPESFEKVITERTKAVIPVHLTGLMCDMDRIREIADRNGIYVLEDAAQSVGASYKGKKSGSKGHIGCFSLHPLKNLAGIGDGGIITTNNKEIADSIKMMRNNGLMDRDRQKIVGTVSRLDTLNAAILRVRMCGLDKFIAERRRRAELYHSLLESNKNHSYYHTEKEDNRIHTYHTFSITAENRDGLREYLDKMGVDTKIHYPVPIHCQPVFTACASDGLGNTIILSEKILSLPIADVSDDDIKYICVCIRTFYGEN